MNTDPQDQAIDWRPGWTKGLTAQAALLPPGVAPQAPGDPMTVELDMDHAGRIIGASLVRADGQRAPVQIVGDLAAAQKRLAEALPSASWAVAPQTGPGVSSAGFTLKGKQSRIRMPKGIVDYDPLRAAYELWDGRMIGAERLHNRPLDDRAPRRAARRAHRRATKKRRG